MLPTFTTDGLLPDGIHEAAWTELVTRFGHTARRRQLLTGLAEALRLLREAGCRAVVLGGSFVSAKPEPGDFDAAWVSADVDVDALDPIFFEFDNGRAAQKARFGGEFFPAELTEGESGRTFVDFFRRTRDDEPVGVVLLINLETVP